MPIEKVLRAFAEDNFNPDATYYPVSHGQTAIIKPLALVVKKPRSIFKRPFAKSDFIVTGVLDDYVVKEKIQEFTETVNAKIIKEENLEIGDEEDEEEEGASRFVAVKLEAAKSVKVDVKIADDLGELELGKLEEEYFKDPDLRDVLAKTDLDANRMEGLEEQELRLIYSVVFSEKFLLKGNRKHEIVGMVDAGATGAVPEVVEALSKYAQVKGKFRKRIIPPKPATRNTRGPVFFKFVRVDYDKENGRLKLSEGKFVGPAVSSKNRSTEADKTEYNESIVDIKDEERVFSEPLTEDDIKKLDIIKDAVLMAEESREKRKERVKKYLNWFEEVLMTGQRKLFPSEPLTEEDRNFLRRIFCSVLPNQSIVDLPEKTFDTEKLQGYAIVLKQIDDLSDEHWDEIEKAWAEAEQNK